MPAAGTTSVTATKSATTFYSDALHLACSDLDPCNPVRLGLALNFAVFYWELLEEKEKAIKLTEITLQSAVEKIDDCVEDTFEDAKYIIQILRDNLLLW